MLLDPALEGRWESVVDVESTDEGQLAEAADERLRASGRARFRLRVVRPGGFGEPWPGFGLGDRPLVVDDQTALGSQLPARMRVISYSVSLEPPHLEFVEAELEAV
jgi:hypothetical protein